MSDEDLLAGRFAAASYSEVLGAAQRAKGKAMTPEERAEAVMERVVMGDYADYSDDWYDPRLRAKLAGAIAAAIREAVAAERERCAKVADDTAAEYRTDAADYATSDYAGMLLGKADGAALVSVRIRKGAA